MPSPVYLIVDDSPTVRLTIRRALVQERVPESAILEADGTGPAIERFDAAHPSVVFLDISLTEGTPPRGNDVGFLNLVAPASRRFEDGQDVARYMLAADPKVRIIVCTGNPPDDPRVRELIKGGAFHLIQKPVRHGQIREVLTALREDEA